MSFQIVKNDNHKTYNLSYNFLDIQRAPCNMINQNTCLVFHCPLHVIPRDTQTGLYLCLFHTCGCLASCWQLHLWDKFGIHLICCLQTWMTSFCWFFFLVFYSCSSTNTYHVQCTSYWINSILGFGYQDDTVFDVFVMRFLNHKTIADNFIISSLLK